MGSGWKNKIEVGRNSVGQCYLSSRFEETSRVLRGNLDKPVGRTAI